MTGWPFILASISTKHVQSRLAQAVKYLVVGVVAAIASVLG
jgi:hypothetical protein